MKYFNKQLNLGNIFIIFILLALWGCNINSFKPEQNINVEILKPLDGEEISEPFRIQLKITPSSSNYSVSFYANYTLISEEDSYPYECYWNVGFWAGQSVTLRVIVKNNLGKEITQTLINVNISENAVKGPIGIHPTENQVLIDNNQLFVRWSEVEGALKYQMQISEKQDFNIIYRDTILNNNLVYLPFLKYGQFYWRVRYQIGNESWSDWNKEASFVYAYDNGGFEYGDFSGWALEYSNPDRITIESTNCYVGNYCVKVKLSPGDRVNNGHRTELVRYDFGMVGKERFYEFAYKFDENFVDHPMIWTIIQQFHDMPDFLKGETWENYIIKPPPIFIHYKQDTCKVIIHTIKNGFEEIGKFHIVKGLWFKIRFEIKWSFESDGYIIVLFNNEPITPWNGTDYKYYSPTVYNQMGNYFKVGQYGSEKNTSNNTYLDEVNIGDVN